MQGLESGRLRTGGAVEVLDRIFKAYDVRGRYREELDEDVAEALGAAFARFAGEERVLVGRDARLSSPLLSEAFMRGVAAAGARPIDLGLVSTDLTYFASGRLGLPAAMFTASHNPPEWNGVKLSLPGAFPVGEDTGLGEVKKLAEEYLASGRKAPELPEVEPLDLLEEYARHCASFVGGPLRRTLKVVVDGGNGVAGVVVPAVFRLLPFELIPLYFEPDGRFPNHPPDPIRPENVRDLQRAVLEEGADVGLAFDGDADRVFLVDERARGVEASLVGALVARELLSKEPGAPVVHNVICSRVVPETILEAGGRPVPSRVGHAFIKRTMAETGAVFGCEHSGHYYFRENYRADSGLIAAVVVLGILAREDRPLSSLLAPYRRYFSSGEVNVRVEDRAGAVQAVAEHFRGARLDFTDGVTAEGEDWWVNVRPSNTEPLVRINVEAREERRVEELLGEVLAVLGAPRG